MKKKLLAFAFLTAGLAHSQNLIQNNSFEQFTGTPNSWTVENGTVAQENSITHEGSSSLKATPTGIFPVTLPYFWLSQSFTLNDLEVYTLRFDYYIPGTSSGNIDRVGFDLLLNNSSDAYFFPSMPQITPKYGTWETVTFDFNILMFKSPATSASIKLMLMANSQFENKSIYFDNVTVVKKAALSTTDFDLKNNPISSISKDEILLDSNFKFSFYEIYTIDGKTIKSTKNNPSANIDISGLNKGVYLLKFKEYSKTIKFIKQ
jgi:hypothetical protein